MIVTPPVRYDRLRDCLQTVLTDALGSTVTVKWSRDSVPRDNTKGDMVVLTPTSGAAVNGNWRGRFGVLSPDTVTFTVTSVTVGALYSLYLNNFPYRHEAVGGDTANDVRDGIVALIALDTVSPYTAAAGGVGEVVVTAAASGAIWEAHLLPSSDWTVVQGTLVPTVVQQRSSVTTFTVGSFSKGTKLFDGAHVIDSKVDAAFRLQKHQTTFEDFGVSPQSRGIPTDLSAIAGSTWESRVSRDVGFGLESVTTETTNSIESAGMTVNFKTPQGASIFTQQYTLTS